MSRTLEEAIEHAEAVAIENEKEAERKREYGGAFYDSEVQACLICAEQHRQLAEWLKELAERRKLPEIIRCGECRFNDGTAYCVFHFRYVKGNEYCSWGEKKHVENG